jgi:hypothetical protein
MLIVAINDRFADGTDVSWLWDVDFEVLASGPARDGTQRILCSGTRAADMALRLKYAGLPDEVVDVEPQVERAADMAFAHAQSGGCAAIFPTYTAMLQMRRHLQHHGSVVPFWED